MRIPDLSSFFGQYHVFVTKTVLFARNIIRTISYMTGQQTTQLSEIKNNLAKLSVAMETIISDSEPDFLQLGNELQSIYGTATNLCDIVIQSGRGQSDAPEEKVMNQISGFAMESVGRLTGCRDEIAESQVLIETGKQNLDKLTKTCRKNEQLAMLLNVIALNIAVESNRTKQSSEMFVVFAQEIKQVAENMNKITQNLNEDSTAAYTGQEKFQTHITSQADQLIAVTKDAESVVANAVEKVDQLSVIFENAVENGIRESKEISNQVAEVVMAIQFHDIIRQQMEHVIQSVKDAEQSCRKDISDTDWGNIYTILKIQAAQIQQVINEIDTAEKQIIQSLENIETKASTLSKSLTESIISSAEELDRSENPFKILIQSLENLSHLINKAYTLKNFMSSSAVKASEVISSLEVHTKRVQDISLDLHRKALNAIIKSAHLGSAGATFEILAQEVTSVSRQSNLFASNVERIIETVSLLADKLRATNQNITLEETTDTDTPKLQADSEVQKVTELYNLFLENTSHASSASKNLEATIHETKQSLSFFKMLIEKLNVPLSEIITLQEVIAPHADTDEQRTKDTEESTMRYTMESERLIHTQILNQQKNMLDDKPVADRASGDTMPEEEDTIELFDDVDNGSDAIELFGEDDTEEPSIEPKEQDGNLELFVPEEEGTEKTAMEAEDNVELFDDTDSDSDAIELFEDNVASEAREEQPPRQDDQIADLKTVEPEKREADNAAHTSIVFEEEKKQSADKKTEPQQEEDNIEFF